MRQKILIFALDGATWDVIDPLIKQGKLPTFKKFLEKSRWAVLKSTTPPLTPCAWTSFITGKNPGKHGLYDFYYVNENNELKLNSAQTSKSEKNLWNVLTEKNMRSIIFNVPMTYPPQEINGIIVSDAPDPKSDFVYPQEYKKVLLSKFPDYRVEEKKKYGEDKKSKKQFFQDVCDLDLLRIKIMNFLLETEKWDFFMVHFTILDRIQHWYWKFMDKSHPAYIKNDCSEYIAKAYQLMDKAFNETLEKIPKNSIILIMSDHGFGKYIKDVNINFWLKKENYLFFNEANISLFKKFLKKIGFSPNKIVKLIFYFKLGFLLKDIFHKHNRIFYKIMNKATLTYRDIDYSKSKAYSYGYYGPIYINKKLVRDKKEYEELRNNIMNKIRLIKDPVYNKELINNIWKKEELYQGPKTYKLPDIVFTMQNYSFGASTNLAFASNKLFSDPITYKTGDHRDEGIFAVYGPYIKKGENKPINIIDLYPTLLYMLDSKIPADVDGKVLTEFFKDAFKSKKVKNIYCDIEKEGLKGVIKNLKL